MKQPRSARPGPQVHTRLIPLGDVEIACDAIQSDADAPGRPPLVLLHGLTGHRADFAPLLPPLAARLPGRRILVPDLRGHGDSTHGAAEASFAFPRLLADLLALLDDRAVPRAHLLGHSFGGMVALRFALAHPDRLASLMLVSTAPFAPPEFSVELFEKTGALAESRGMAALQALIERRARSESSARRSDRWLARWEGAYWPHHRHRYRSMDPAAYRALGIAMARQAPVTDRLGHLVLATTVLVGADDEGFLDGADRLAEEIPGAVSIRLEQAGHHPHREDPEGWLEALVDHLARAEAAR
ncbi:MAG: alpha/beta hydrolase [Myxococcota bacterium]